jgi:hypothetical protein
MYIPFFITSSSFLAEAILLRESCLIRKGVIRKGVFGAN